VVEPAGDAPATFPTRTYVICASPRTGSYLLCEGLQNTGIAGNPNEYLSGGFQRYWTSRWGIRSYPAYLRRITALGTGDNGVFGVKVHPVQFDHFVRQVAGTDDVPADRRRDILERQFPDPCYIWLRRDDRLRQAVSYTKSIQTKIWWDTDKAPSPYDAPRPEFLQFDRSLIEWSMAQLEEADAAWGRYFAANGIEPLVLTYEQLVENVEGAVRQVVDQLGLTLPDGFSLPPSQFRRQADEVTEDWVATYQRGPDDAPRRSTASTLTPVIANRTWWRCATPFPHLRADRVFVEDTYERMAAEFRDLLAADGFKRDIPGYDASAHAVTADDPGAFSVFVSRAWRDLLADLLGSTPRGHCRLRLPARRRRCGTPRWPTARHPSVSD
jgi:LPS sulfotransferase NodH